MIVICSWCQKVKSIDVTTVGISHGICAECEAEWLEKCKADQESEIST